MENLALIESFSEFKDDKLIDRVTLMTILEDVFRNALKKKFGDDDNFDIIINPDKGDLEIWRNRIVSGLSLMPKVTVIVGGSMGWACSGVSTAKAQSVSETVALLIPASETISPASASSISCGARPRKACMRVTRNCSIFWPNRVSAWMVAPTFKLPLSTRPVKMRPTKGSLPNVVASI